MSADPVALAASLGRPLAHRWMTRGAALASIAVATDAGMRQGTLPGGGTLDERLHIYSHILSLYADREAHRCDLARYRIKRTAWPLIEIRAPSNKILAEAFNANEDAGSPLTEDEVTETVKTLLFWALQKRKAA